MVGFKMNVPSVRTSASVLAVILMTSGAFAEGEVTAGTEAGLPVEIYPGDEPGISIDPLPDDAGEGILFDDAGEGIVWVEPDPTEGGDVPVDDGGASGEPGGDPETGVVSDGDSSDCGGCEYQTMEAELGGPEAPAMAASDRAVQGSSSRSALSGVPVKNSCLYPERYVPWLCDWQKDLGLIGQ